ncbi:threonine/homoserine/homoserine lactone efflux protein [Silvimonas terrae]|uniref:Threonine/homoserine/homoserine lactone efflux protein n=1 Tax=Silvimonas terrae TaxID=300266 RepID=A0A840RME3_9NEIS|nr:LysE family translocator [Silvimonas terrae]MBB5193362.1 threonine/homoserine/homoserine lactone efflux protein [Silvimonas terrae]
MQSLLPFTVFALVASITPGPANILVLSSSARFGLLPALRLTVGICMAASSIVLFTGWGLGNVLTAHPGIQTGAKWLALAWLSHLSWLLFRHPPAVPQAGETGRGQLGMLAGGGLQIVNPKVWMMALAVVSVFAGNGPDKTMRVAQMALIFFAAAILCMALWALLGRGVAVLLRSPQHWRWLNQALAVLLLLSAWSSMLG